MDAETSWGRCLDRTLALESDPIMYTRTGVSDRTFYAYLAKAEGRKRKGFTPEAAVPLIEDGRQVTHSQEKCEVIARNFAERLAAPSEQRTNTGEEGAGRT